MSDMAQHTILQKLNAARRFQASHVRVGMVVSVVLLPALVAFVFSLPAFQLLFSLLFSLLSALIPVPDFVLSVVQMLAGLHLILAPVLVALVMLATTSLLLWWATEQRIIGLSQATYPAPACLTLQLPGNTDPTSHREGVNLPPPRA